jgi:hypothetical protein
MEHVKTLYQMFENSKEFIASFEEERGGYIESVKTELSYDSCQGSLIASFVE